MQFIARVTFTETLLFRHDVSVNAVNPDDATKIVEAAYGDYVRRGAASLVIQGTDYGAIHAWEQRGDAPAKRHIDAVVTIIAPLAGTEKTKSLKPCYKERA